MSDFQQKSWRILIVTDAWYPQVNGVVRTLDTIGGELRQMGHDVHFITPDLFRSMPCPTYPEIRLAFMPGRLLARMIDGMQPCVVHVATEGPLGLAARNYCLKRKLPFTTSFHTRFPEYIQARAHIPARWFYPMISWFHNAAACTMVATETLRDDLASKGFKKLGLWGRGVDVELFKPREKDFLPDARPILLYVGRVAVEKNIADFLDLEAPGSKVVVGDGPQLASLKRKYPNVRFVGSKSGEELARYYAAADVFVFPSRTDTFGNVVLEALASGVPVAAYPVPGPKDVLQGQPVGVLNEDLGYAVREALKISPTLCRDFALSQSWRASAEQFLSHVVPFETAWPSESKAAPKIHSTAMKSN
jgi:glycosyltransferase involved in cell wall biosynthesis